MYKINKMEKDKNDIVGIIIMIPKSAWIRILKKTKIKMISSEFQELAKGKLDQIKVKIKISVKLLIIYMENKIDLVVGWRRISNGS